MTPWILNPFNGTRCEYSDPLDYLPCSDTTSSNNEWSGIADIQAKFKNLASTWRRETRHFSSVTQIITHPSYLKIIGMGVKVLPFILADLAKTNDHWFCALEAISGEDPVREQDRGIMHQMTQSWLQWGKLQGIL